MTIAPSRLSRRLALFAAFVLAGCAGDLPQAPPPADTLPAPSLFTLSPGTPADGTVQLRLERGSTTARGVLRTNAQTFRFAISGLSVQGGAPARATVTGRVFGLRRTGDFAGTYRDVGGVASDLGAALRLGNDNLVLIELRSAPAGLALGVPPGGATVSLTP